MTIILSIHAHVAISCSYPYTCNTAIIAVIRQYSLPSNDNTIYEVITVHLERQDSLTVITIATTDPIIRLRHKRHTLSGLWFMKNAINEEYIPHPLKGNKVYVLAHGEKITQF